MANVNLNCSITCIEDPGCYAGTTAPTISGNTIANTCPANTVDLTSLVTGTCPTGSLAKWFTSSTPSATNMVADAANATAGTYYVACADAVNNCYSSASGAVTATINGCVNGTIDCSKTQIYTAPVVGQAAQKTLLVTINVTSAGCFSPITVSGSGMTVPAGFNQICTTTTGIQQFSIPVNYSGAALGTMNFTIGSATNAGSCSADLTNTPKKAISDVWTLDCVPTTGPSLK